MSTADYNDVFEHADFTIASDFYHSYGRLRSPERERAQLVFGLRSELRRISASNEKQIAMNKITWWQEEIKRAVGGAARHPAFRTFGPIPEPMLLPCIGMTEAARLRLEYDAYPDFHTLSHLYKLDRANQLMACETDQSTPTGAALEAAGIATEITQSLSRLSEDLTQGQLYLPLSDFKQCDLQPDDLRSSAEPGQFTALIDLSIARAKKRFAEAQEIFKLKPTVTTPALRVYLALQQTLLSRVEACKPRLLKSAPRLSPLKKTWIGWRLYSA